MSIRIGHRAGDYAVVRELGAGGCGRVYEVEHAVTGRREAMKVLASGAPGSQEQQDRFLREIRLQASLNHPNIAAVHNAFWTGEELVLVCELLHGQPLHRLLEQGRLPLERSLEITEQVLSALAYAHERGVIHRDVSPANIFVTEPEGAVKLIDFGLAKAAADLRLTHEGAPIGSYRYMSPEQVRGASAPSHATDIYSCGAVLFELATGRPLFEGDNAFAIMQGHCDRTPDDPRSINSEIPESLETAILRAVAKKPEERFLSASSFLEALQEVRLDLSPEGRAPRRQSLRTFLKWAAVAVLALGGLIGALRWSTPSQAQPPEPVAAAQQESVADEKSKAKPRRKNAGQKVGGFFKKINPFRRRDNRPEQDEDE